MWSLPPKRDRAVVCVASFANLHEQGRSDRVFLAIPAAGLSAAFRFLLAVVSYWCKINYNQESLKNKCSTTITCLRRRDVLFITDVPCSWRGGGLRGLLFCKKNQSINTHFLHILPWLPRRSRPISSSPPFGRRTIHGMSPWAHIPAYTGKRQPLHDIWGRSNNLRQYCRDGCQGIGFLSGNRLWQIGIAFWIKTPNT